MEAYRNFKNGSRESDYVNYIKKSSREKKLEERLFKEREKGAKPKTIEMWENRLSRERERKGIN